MDILTDRLLRLLAAFLVMFIHELPKIPMIHIMTHPIHRNELKKRFKPWSSIDPIGIIMFLYMNVGWQKPLEFNPNKFLSKQKGIIAVIMTGFLSSVLGMVFFMMSYNMLENPYLKNLMFYGVYYSFVIIVVNLLPIPPLDMARLIFVASPGAYLKLQQKEIYLHAIFILTMMLNVLPLAIYQLFQISFLKLL